MSSKIAILIDAENISYRDFPRILEEVSRQGEVGLRAVYGDWQRPGLHKWREIAEENNFKMRHQANMSETKNSSDMKLIMDAMEVLHFTTIQVFCLVTNDVDYVPLCDKLHESNKYVIGVGYKHASELLIRACDQFIFIRREEPSVPSLMPASVEIPVSLPKQPTAAVSADQAVIKQLVTQAMAKAPQDAEGWVTLSALGTALSQVQEGFQTNIYGHANLSKLLQNLPDFVELQANGTVKSARLKLVIQSKKQKQTDLQKLVPEAFENTSGDLEGWVTLSALGTALREVEAGFQTKKYGYSNLTKLLQSMLHLVQLKTKSGVKFARLKK